MADIHSIRLDIRGQLCPSCLLQTLKELNRHGADVRSGRAEIVVLTDDRQATSTIPGAAGKMGFRTNVDRQDNFYLIRIYHQK